MGHETPTGTDSLATPAPLNPSPPGLLSRPKSSRAVYVRSACFRVVAVLLALLPFLLVEVALRWLKIAQLHNTEDPFVGFSSIRPLFELSPDGIRYQTSAARRSHFSPDSFAAHKPDHEFRIFCLGGSTVQGNPYSIPTSFTTWLEISLNAADPSRSWEVVNCGGISYASYRLLPILRELRQYQPDLFIVYAGHNEFLEDRSYGHIKQLPPMVAASYDLVTQLHSYNLLRTSYLHLLGRSAAAPPRDRPVLKAEVEALLDYRGGMEFYHRDPAWLQGVMDHFAYNLREMVRTAQEAGVPVMLMNPVCNLRDSPPFKSEHRPGLSSQQLQRWESLWEQARQYYNGRHREAVPLLKQAIAIDDQFAGCHYDLAKCYDALGMLDLARLHYIEAKEQDVCPLRIREPMNQSVLEIARNTNSPLVDARRLFEDLTPGAIPGKQWLVDHVHPSIRGHQVLAGAIVEELERRGVVRPVPGWEVTRDTKYAEHTASLDTIYFVRGQQHLEGLMRWAEGRITKEKPRSPPTPRRWERD